jgi:TolA-binding protein
MDRQHRRDLKHDKFVDEIGSLSERAKENQRMLVTVTAAIVVVALLAYGIYFYRSNREKQAQAALASAIETLESPLLPAAGQPPVTGAKFKTEAERNAAAEKDLRTVTTKYSGSDASDVAKLYLARLDAAKGDVASARKLLQEFAQAHPDHLLVGSARYSLYQIRIENGEAAQVINEANVELAKSAPQLPPDALLAVLAKAYEVQGDAAKSRDTYRRISTEYPDSPYAAEALRRVGPTT